MDALVVINYTEYSRLGEPLTGEFFRGEVQIEKDSWDTGTVRLAGQLFPVTWNGRSWQGNYFQGDCDGIFNSPPKGS